MNNTFKALLDASIGSRLQSFKVYYLYTERSEFISYRRIALYKKCPLYNKVTPVVYDKINFRGMVISV